MNLLRLLIIFLIVLYFSGITSGETCKDTSKIKMGMVNSLDSLELKTGDLAFFQSKTFNGKMIQLGTFSPFTHSAMIVVLEDGTLGLVHATDNDYAGFRIPLINESRRNGVILTKLEDLFISKDDAETGYYKGIWIRKLDTLVYKRPDPDNILKFYESVRHYPFEPSNWQFILSAFDLTINNKDRLHAKNDEKIMCSEFLSLLMIAIDFPIAFPEDPCETTPKDMFSLSKRTHPDVVKYQFKDGKYQIKKN